MSFLIIEQTGIYDHMLSTGIMHGMPITDRTVDMWSRVLGNFVLARWCRDMGMSFDACYFLIFRRSP